MVEDEKSGGGCVFPGVHVDSQKFHYAEVDEEHDEGDDDEEEVGVSFPEILHMLAYLLF